MFIRFIFVFLVLALTGCAVTGPDNLGEHKIAVLAYQRSGAYDRAVTMADARAQDYIIRRAGQVRRPAIVLDIDETSLSNWPELAANDLGFRVDGPCAHLPKGPCGLTAFQALGTSLPLGPTLALYRAARAHNVAVFFITGRDESLRRATAANLRRAGYDGWTRLIMRPHGTTTSSAADYKAPQRAALAALGYTIIANIGDQPSDLAGGYAERAFLVPNPFYRIP